MLFILQLLRLLKHRVHHEVHVPLRVEVRFRGRDLFRVRTLEVLFGEHFSFFGIIESLQVIDD